jgi:hypothetical protein
MIESASSRNVEPVRARNGRVVEDLDTIPESWAVSAGLFRILNAIPKFSPKLTPFATVSHNLRTDH